MSRFDFKLRARVTLTLEGRSLLLQQFNAVAAGNTKTTPDSHPQWHAAVSKVAEGNITNEDAILDVIVAEVYSEIVRDQFVLNSLPPALADVALLPVEYTINPEPLPAPADAVPVLVHPASSTVQ